MRKFHVKLLVKKMSSQFLLDFLYFLNLKFGFGIICSHFKLFSLKDKYYYM